MTKELVDEKVTKQDITRHCEAASRFPHWVLHNSIRQCKEDKHSAARRSNLWKECEKLFREHAPALLSFRNNISHTNCNGNPPTLTLPLRWGGNLGGNSGTPQSLISSNHFTHFTHLTHLTHFKKAAFTLAEVLVTLAVSGIVAAMTIPTLVQNYKKKAIATNVKKTYAELTQVIKLAEIDNGSFNTWTLLDVKGSIEQSRLAFNKYFAPYMSGVTEYSTGNDKAFGCPISVHGVNYILKNGVGLSFKSGSKKIWFNIIVNPNKNSVLGREAFYFYIVDGKILPVGWYAGLTRDEIFNGYSVECSGSICNYKCGKTIKNVTDENGQVTTYSRHGCTPLFYIDGFEFKDDYPW